MAQWKRSEQVAFLRMLDAVTGLVVTPAGREAAGRLVAERLLASAFGMLGGEDVEDEAERAGRCMARLTPTDATDELAVRKWLGGALRERADGLNEGLLEREWGWIDPREHDVWALLELSPFSRRLRVWSATLGLGATALVATMEVGPHQVGHWAAGRSLPSADDRADLAAAVGVHPAWLAADRDFSADSDLFLYRSCPCGSGAELVAGGAERSAYRSQSAESVPVLWCSGCGQAYAALGAAGLIPLPLTEQTEPPDRFPSYRAAYPERGSDFEQPWPHALWCPGPDTVQRGSVRVPGLLTVPPFTPPAAKPPAAPRPTVRRLPAGGGPRPQAGVERTGVERIKALLLWVGGGRRLTDKGLLKLADARMLVNALPTGDRWDHDSGYPCRTRSSAQLPNLQRLVAWTIESGLLEVSDGVLGPTGNHTEVLCDLSALTAALVEALPRLALQELSDAMVAGPLSQRAELATGLNVLWKVLRGAPGPVAPAAVADAVWNGLNDDGDEPFLDPRAAETVVRRDVKHLLVLGRDLDLVADVGSLVRLTATGRRARLPTW